MNEQKRIAKIAYALIFFSGLGLLLGLGSWQLMRGLDKQNLADHLALAGSRTVEITNAAQLSALLPYSRVAITGTLHRERGFALANRIHKGRPGFEMFMPLRIAGDTTSVLVNLGWVAHGQVERSLPRLADRPVRLVGTIYQPARGFTLGPALTDSSRWPVVIQYLDLPALSQAARQPLSDYVVVADSAPQSSYIRIWRPYVMSAPRHFGYAAQWWALAVVLMVFGCIWFRQRPA